MDDQILGIIRDLYGKQPMRREPVDSELQFFGKNPHVGGYADFDSGSVVLNPEPMDGVNTDAVYINEAARLAMRGGRIQPPNFDLTDKQRKYLSGTHYGTAPKLNQMETIIGRILSGDPSAQDYTPQQKEYALRLGGLMAPYNGRFGR